MTIPELAALLVVLLAGLYLLGLGAFLLLLPSRATAFLRAFASSARAHYIELAIRLLVGVAFIVAAPALPGSGCYLAFGWMLLITSVTLLLIPWAWHRRFAERAVPAALKHRVLMALCAVLAGGVVVACAIAGLAA